MRLLQQGLRYNRAQFWLLVLINGFVGSMVGLERSIIPGLGEYVYHINGHTAMLSFIMAFGASKAVFNLLTGRLTKKISRRNVLAIGWWAAIPIPFILMYAPSWGWVILANILLGVNQGLAWSATVIMKIDLVGEKNRGLAMGINEFAGYLSVGAAAYLSASIAGAYGFVLYPFLPGVLFAFAGLLLTLLFVKDTAYLVHEESKRSTIPFFDNIWKETTWHHCNLGSVTVNGLVNNLNDAVVWGLLPIFMAQKHYSIGQIGLLAGLYPAIWGLGQLGTGKLGDIFCKKQLLTAGMFIQAFALILISFSNRYTFDLFAMLLLGVGTALVYPNFLTLIAENTHPVQRAQSLSIFRFWRDSGYVLGAILSGILADIWGIAPAFQIIGVITATAGAVAHIRMCCTKRLIWKASLCNEASLQAAV